MDHNTSEIWPKEDGNGNRASVLSMSGYMENMLDLL